jgi:hypothetical protein
VKSFALLRTNVGLTTNIKIMVDSKYSLSLDSIESKEELSATKYKKVSFIKDNYYDELVTYFFGNLPTETAFYIKYDNDIDTMSNNYANQYDELYQYGARNIINNKNYEEEFEYFAPLYISPGSIPKNFIIFRVDGPGIEKINRSNIRNQIFKKFKTVKMFDLTKSTNFGEWLDINFGNNSFFPLTPLELSFENLEFTKWNGIDYETGGYTSKSNFLNTYYEEEKEVFEFEKFIFDGYKNHKVVFPNILNLSFLFDDTPASSDRLRKWSINRYYGFYLDDMVKVKTLSPYITPFLKSDVVIQSDNFIYSNSGDPFMEGFFDHKVYYVEYLGEYYKVEKVIVGGKTKLQSNKSGKVFKQEYKQEQLTKYKIISDLDLSGKQSLLNKNIGLIDENKKLINYDISNFQIEDWESADVWIIEIDGVYHNLIKDTDGSIKVFSDYSFDFNENDYTYWINKPDSSYTKKVSFIVDKNNQPKKFNIYKLKFTDIKDFDDRIVDTEYSKYEYEKKYDLTDTDETKMYLINLLSNSNPKDYDDFFFKEEVINVPVSSEYTANYETFKIDGGDLSQIWRKNPVYCRWGYQNSLSANDYPYVLNNSLVFEDYNRTINPFDPDPKRIERNLDYFYTINSSTYSYLHHTLHVEDFNSDKSLNQNYEFELDKYLNLGTYSSGTVSATYSFDYFTYFFERKSFFDSGEISKNVKKYSLFNEGDSSIPNITLFRGIKFIAYDIDGSSIKKDETGKVDTFNLKTSNTFDGYKFSIILTDNELSVSDTGGITSSANTMNWTIFDDWKMDKTYQLGDLVVMDDIIYQSTIVENVILKPNKEYPNMKKVKSAPYNQTTWVPYNLPTSTFGSNNGIFWSPTFGLGVFPSPNLYPDRAVDYSPSSLTPTGIVYNSGDYYKYSGGLDDFWNPITSDSSGYSYGQTILFNGQYFMSMTSSNHHRPDYKTPFVDQSKYIYYWTATQSSNPKWEPILLWNPSTYYPSNLGATYVVHEDVVYKTTATGNISYGSETGTEPGTSTDWERVYSLTPDTNIVYKPTYNPILEINDSYYLLNSNTSNSTLECGINIYINKKWKNILININISDNTTIGLSNKDRDFLYNELNKKLTAFNFIKCVNDISNRYEFTDYLNYIIIDEDGKVTKYNYDDLEKLPYLIVCETPDEVSMKHKSLHVSPVDLPKSLKPTKVLKSIDISLSNLNYYNQIPPASEIVSNKKTPVVSKIYHGGRNIIEDVIYRYSGFYMPLFYDIELFSKNFFTSSVGNYRFDESLTEFGIVKEKKIRKVNKSGSILKLRDEKDQKSMYPMLDEFGYTVIDFFVFKSTWDIEYHYTTEVNQNVKPIISLPPIGNSLNNTIGQRDTNENSNL